MKVDFIPLKSISFAQLIFTLLSIMYCWITFDFFAYRYLLVSLASILSLTIGYFVLASKVRFRVVHSRVSTRFDLFCCYLSLFSVFCILFDRIYLRGIDYFELGFAAARAEFGATELQGSPISVFGNIFAMSIFLPIMNNIFEWEDRDKERLLIAFLSILSVIFLTYATGGRTILLMSLAIVSAAMIARGVSGKTKLPNFLTPLRLAVSVGLLLFFSGFVFWLRADAFGVINSTEYAHWLCAHLTQPSLDIVSQCKLGMGTSANPSIVDTIFDYGNAVLLYAFHTAWISESVLIHQNAGNSISFAGVQDLLFGRFGYELVPTYYDGYFVPLAAGSVNDFGYVGVFLFYGSLGLLIRIFEVNIKRGKIWLGRTSFIYILAAAFLSSLISPANLPFFILAIISTTILGATQNIVVPLFVRDNRRTIS